jgi:hypothetical protein
MISESNMLAVNTMNNEWNALKRIITFPVTGSAVLTED